MPKHFYVRVRQYRKRFDSRFCQFARFDQNVLSTGYFNNFIAEHCIKHATKIQKHFLSLSVFSDFFCRTLFEQL